MRGRPSSSSLRRVALVAMAAALCGAATTDVSDPVVVKGGYDSYVAGADHCPKFGPDARPRMFLAGFASMHGKLNPSGTVIDAMSKGTFWPGGVITATAGTFDTITDSSDLACTDNRARIVSRALIIDGVEFTACLAILPVAWDLAAAIVVDEMELFRPDVVLLVGQNGNDNAFRIEAFAHNGTSSPALDESGVYGKQKVLPYPLDLADDLYFGWDAAMLAARVSCLVGNLNCSSLPSATAPCGALQPGGGSGGFVCNNVAYVAVVAKAGVEVCLASPIGTKDEDTCKYATIRRRIDVPLANTIVGFVHLPTDLLLADPGNIELTARVLARIAATASPQGTVNSSCDP